MQPTVAELFIILHPACLVDVTKAPDLQMLVIIDVLDLLELDVFSITSL
jgi:hypothetical protein